MAHQGPGRRQQQGVQDVSVQITGLPVTYQTGMGWEAHPPLVHAPQEQQRALDVRENCPDCAGQSGLTALPTTAPPERCGQEEAKSRIAAVSRHVTVVVVRHRVESGMRGDPRQEGRRDGGTPTPYREPGDEVNPARRQDAFLQGEGS